MRQKWRVRGAHALLLLSIAAAALAATVLAGCADKQAGAGSSRPAASSHAYQELAALSTSHQVFATPGGRPFEQISATRPITGEQTVLPVMNSARHGGAEWLQVQLPGRPNGRTGWIERSGAKLEYTRWRIAVDLATRRVYAYDGGRLVRSFGVVVGAPATPTPKGQFFVEENVALGRSVVGYPYALALSARSNVIQEFAGGPGQIALHGLDNVGGTLGTAVSHGCIRLDTSDISWLAKHVEVGDPVTVY
jgi:lipoprotein-anchoring transpeptidase ErfK/SrfK